MPTLPIGRISGQVSNYDIQIGEKKIAGYPGRWDIWLIPTLCTSEWTVPNIGACLILVNVLGLQEPPQL